MMMTEAEKTLAKAVYSLIQRAFITQACEGKRGLTCDEYAAACEKADKFFAEEFGEDTDNNAVKELKYTCPEAYYTIRGYSPLFD